MKAEILKELRTRGDFVSGQELCEKLGVSRTAVWKGIQKLRGEGYEIEAVQNRGYRLAGMADVLNQDELESLRKTAWIGQEIYYFDVTDSTNIQAKRLAEEGSVHGTYVVADRQEAGRGRRGRGWDSPANSGIFMTLLLKPQFAPQKASMLTLVAAMAVTRAIRELFHLDVQIKWPNDIVLNGKKICGILTEMNSEIDTIHYVVVGIGINVTNEAFPPEIADTATSLFQESGKRIHRADLIEAIWEWFEVYYADFTDHEDLSGIREEYNSYLANRDRKVRVLDPKDPFDGVAKGIDAEGELLVETEQGMEKVSSGEVSVRGIYGYV